MFALDPSTLLSPARRCLQGIAPSLFENSWLNALFGIGALALALLVALEGWFIVHLLRQNGRLLARLEAVEAHLGIDPGSSADLDPPRTGLPPGANAPAFKLPDLDGRLHSLESMLAAGEPVLLIFSNPGCPACDALAPDIAEWNKSLSGVRVVVVSHGSTELHRRQFEGFSSPPLVLLQENMEVEAAYGVQMTPSAVIVDERGRISDWLAAGARAARQLVELAKSGVSQS